MHENELILLFLIAGTFAFAGPRFAIGVGIGNPYDGYAASYPAGYYAAPPVPVGGYVAYPGPGYSWVDGSWYPYRARYAWRPGYWARPPYRGAYWVRPRYYGGRYRRGYWRR